MINLELIQPFSFLKERKAKNARLQSRKYPNWWVSYEDQIGIVSRFLERYGGDVGFTPGNIPPIPRKFISKTKTEVPMLVVILPNKCEMNSIQRTFEAWWDFIIPPSSYEKVRWNGLRSGPNCLMLAPGIENKPGIYWVGFDPNANYGKSIGSCYESVNVGNLAHAHLLMALAIFQNWSLSWNGEDSPYPNLSGYQFYWNDDWLFSVYLNRWDSEHRIGIGISRAGDSVSTWSSPIVREL